MRHDSALDGDFAAYLEARWPTLVRTLVLLGAPAPAAEAATRTAMARCYRRWAHLRDTDDLEVEAYRALLDSWAARRLHPDLDPDRELHGEAPGDPTEQALPLTRLEHELDRLTPDVRAAVVLRLVAGLDEAQVAGALDVRHRIDVAGTEDAEEEVFREAAECVEVLAAPLPAVLAEARLQRRRTARLVTTGAAVVLVLVALGAWLGNRSGPAPEASAAPRVIRVENTSEVAWWANGVLHLRHVDVELARVADLVEVDDGAVYGDDRGGVFFVDADGVVTTLGHKDADQPLVGFDDTGWAAWVDPAGDSPELVVYDVTARSELARRSLRPDTPGNVAHPVALDRDTVYYEDSDGPWQWQVPAGDPEELTRPGLVDVAQATQVWQRGDGMVQMVQPFFSVSFTRPGLGGRLSPTAEYLLTREPGTVGSDQFGRVLIYDTRSGDRLWNGLRRGDLAVATALGPYDEVHYVIARKVDMPGSGEFVRSSSSGAYELRTCHIGERSCFTVAKFPRAGQLPVLAH